MQTLRLAPVPLLLTLALAAQDAPVKPPPRPIKMANPPRAHAVSLGPIRRVPYTPPDITPDERNEDTTTLKIRSLTVDERQREVDHRRPPRSHRPYLRHPPRHAP